MHRSIRARSTGSGSAAGAAAAVDAANPLPEPAPEHTLCQAYLCERNAVDVRVVVDADGMPQAPATACLCAC